MRGNEKRFGTVAVSTMVIVLLFSVPITIRATTTNLNTGESINLATVINNGLSVEIGDKIFADFGFTYNDFGAPDLDLASSNVNVKALSNNTGFGLEFQEPLSAVNTKTKDITFQYTAMVDPNFNNLISDIHLSIVATHSGAGTGVVNEVVYNDAFGGTQVGELDAYVAGPTETSDTLGTQVDKLWVSKFVEVSGHNGGPTSAASITSIDQTFSQMEIPEPGALFLTIVGLLGAVALKRRS